MANGDGDKALQLIEDKIKDLLDDDKASAKTLLRGVLEVNLSLLPFYYQQQGDHKKTETMWNVFRPALAAGTVLIGLITTLFWKIFTNELSITGKP